MSDSRSNDDAAPKGGPPASEAHTNGPGMTNGIPDGMNDAAATATPDTDREGAETATDAGGDG